MRASLAIRAMSQTETSRAPLPAATPLTAAMVGLPQLYTWSRTSSPCRASGQSVPVAALVPRAREARASVRSMPAQNAGPVPVMMMARTAASAT